jgi:septal ring factor EnvC (AmiA/AmiB activator)
MVPGGEAAGGDVMTDGLAALMQMLQRDIAALDAANARLTQSQEHLAAERRIVADQATELTADLTSWERDVAAATKLAAAFEAEAARAAERLTATEGEIVRLGRELNDAVEQAVGEIDLIAPPADRGATAPAATF